MPSRIPRAVRVVYHPDTWRAPKIGFLPAPFAPNEHLFEPELITLIRDEGH